MAFAIRPSLNSQPVPIPIVIRNIRQILNYDPPLEGYPGPNYLTLRDVKYIAENIATHHHLFSRELINSSIYLLEEFLSTFNSNDMSNRWPVLDNTHAGATYYNEVREIMVYIRQIPLEIIPSLISRAWSRGIDESLITMLQHIQSRTI